MADLHELIIRHGREAARGMVPVRQQSLVDIAAEILAAETNDFAATYAGFCLTSLPHRDPGVRTWERKNGRCSLLIEAGRISEGGRWLECGLPFGSKARLILLYMQTMAIRVWRVRAPSDGIVALLVAEPGEAIVPGQPVMTLQATGKRWASFNIREDQLGDLRLGSQVELIPDNGAGPINAKVDELIPRGEFATWRAARAVGDYDLNTFQIRIDADEAPNGLESGMTVWVQPR